jgi:hypothetical protein
VVATQHQRISFQSLVRLSIIIGLLAFLVPGMALSQTSFPQITHVYPAVIERGKTSEITLYCETSNPSNPIAVLFAGTGIKAEGIPETGKTTELKIKVTVDKTASPGMREFRLACASGASTVGQILIADLPVVLEKTAPHADFATAQPINIGSIVSGLISAKEQVDAYKFTVKAAQTVSFGVVSHRFFYKRHSQFLAIDPIISIHDATGRELAANDDFHFADPSVSYRFNSPGEYMIVVRDVDYAASINMPYNLIVTGGPYVTWCHPLAHSPKGPFQVKVGGGNVPETPVTLEGIPSNAASGSTLNTVIKTEGGLSNSFPIYLSGLKILEESTTNPDFPFPCTINGRIFKPGETDIFPIKLKKGESIIAEIRARRLGSELDSFLTITDDKGKIIASNDDQSNATKDSYLTYTATVDGIFKIQVRDLLNRGGPGFNYLLNITNEEPDFVVNCDDDKAGISPGMAAAWYVRVKRTGGFVGAITFHPENLPAGISMIPLNLPETQNDGLLLFQCAKDAKPGASLVNIIAKAKYKDKAGNEREIIKRVSPLTELKMPGGGRSTWPVETQMIAITPEKDIVQIKVSPEKIILEPGKTIAIDVEIVRADNYKGRVSLDIRHQHLGQIFGNPLPPGVTMLDTGAKTALSEKETKGKILLKIAPDAKPFEEVPICILANVSLNFTVKRGYASNPIMVNIPGK